MRVELNLTKLNTEKHSRYSNSIIAVKEVVRRLCDGREDAHF